MKISLLLSLLPLLLTSCNYDPYHHYFNEWDDTIDFIINDLGLPEEKFGVLYNLELGDSSVTKEISIWRIEEYTFPEGMITSWKWFWVNFEDYLPSKEVVMQFATDFETNANVGYERDIPSPYDDEHRTSVSFSWISYYDVPTVNGPMRHLDFAYISLTLINALPDVGGGMSLFIVHQIAPRRN